MSSTPPAESAAATPVPPPARILVVDDEPALLRLMAFVLQKQGYAMLTAVNGEEALEKVRSQRPDLVVLDIMMPRMDGYQVAGAIRDDPDLAEIPLVMLSAKAQEEDVARGLEVGVDIYITKPFEPSYLAEVVAGLLAGGRHPETGRAVSEATAAN